MPRKVPEHVPPPVSGGEEAGRPLSPRLHRYGGAALSGALLAAAHPPLDLWWLAFGALVPWMVVLLRDRGVAHKGPAFLFGLVHFGLGASWLFPLHPAFPVAAAAILSGCPLLFRWLVALAARRGAGAAALAVPVAWVATDLLRERVPWGFGWLFPGHVLVDVTPLRVATALAGVPALTLLLVGVNTFLAVALLRRTDGPAAPSRRAAAGLGMGVALLGAVLLGYGFHRAGEAGPSSGRRLELLLVQPAFPLHLKAEAQTTEVTAERMMDEQFALTARGLEEHGDVSLVVWAETMVPGTVHFRAAGVPEDRAVRLFRWIAREVSGEDGRGPRFMGGTLVRDVDGGRRNAMFLLSRRGEIDGRVDKVHLTPFGEYLPLLPWLPGGVRRSVEGWVRTISPFLPDLVPGETPLLAMEDTEGRPVRVGSLLCYEVAFAPEARHRTMAGAEVLLNPANYGWYGRWMHAQTLAVARFRAAECGRPVVLATNDGPTAVVNALGEVDGALPSGVAGTLRASVEPGTGTTPYVATGDLLAWLCVAAALLSAIRTGRRPGNLLTPSEGAA